tara:strand:- start:2901 stop:3164 length:264 start_codon:yes stop_codon:yes gene_type:complete
MGSISKFTKFFLIWYSQQMAIPFWIIGHVHLHFATWHDAYEYGLSIFLHLMVAVGFWIDWKQNGDNIKTEGRGKDWEKIENYQQKKD